MKTQFLREQLILLRELINVNSDAATTTPIHGSHSSKNSEGVQHNSRYFKSVKVKVTLKDTDSSMPRFANLRNNSLRWSPRRRRDAQVHANVNIVYNLCSNFSDPNVATLPEPKSFLEKIFYTQEKMSMLVDITIN